MIRLIKLILLSIFLSFVLEGNMSFARDGLPDYYLGDKGAPITIYYFGSLMCPHCADSFKLLMGPIKSKYIDTKKIKVVFIPFPIFGEKDTMALAILYYTDNNNQFFRLADLIYANQQKLYFSKKYTESLENYAKLDGISDSKISIYKTDKNIPKIIEKNATKYINDKNYAISGTPTLIIVKSGTPILKNSRRIVGEVSETELEKNIDNFIIKNKI